MVSLLYINIEIGKNILNARLAGCHLYCELLFSWLSLMVSLMLSFCAVPVSHKMSRMRSET